MEINAQKHGERYSNISDILAKRAAFHKARKNLQMKITQN